MTLNLTWEGVVFAAAVLGAIAVIWKWINGGVEMAKKPAENEKHIEELSQHHEADMREMREELRILTYGILACLKGQQEQGCNGPVTDAVVMIEKHLNKKAHE